MFTLYFCALYFWSFAQVWVSQDKADAFTGAYRGFGGRPMTR